MALALLIKADSNQDQASRQQAAAQILRYGAGRVLSALKPWIANLGHRLMPGVVRDCKAHHAGEYEHRPNRQSRWRASVMKRSGKLNAFDIR